MVSTWTLTRTDIEPDVDVGDDSVNVDLDGDVYGADLGGDTSVSGSANPSLRLTFVRHDTREEHGRLLNLVHRDITPQNLFAI